MTYRIKSSTRMRVFILKCQRFSICIDVFFLASMQNICMLNIATFFILEKKQNTFVLYLTKTIKELMLYGQRGEEEAKSKDLFLS